MKENSNSLPMNLQFLQNRRCDRNLLQKQQETTAETTTEVELSAEEKIATDNG